MIYLQEACYSLRQMTCSNAVVISDTCKNCYVYARGALKMQNWKLQDRKMRDQKCQKMRDQIALPENAGLKMQDWKIQDRTMWDQNADI